MRGIAAAVVALIALPMAAHANQKDHLAPDFIPGEIFHYQIESHTINTVKTTTPIADPEGGSRSTQTLDLLIRLDVLSPEPGSPPGATHFRVTYEKSHADAESDAFDPTGPSFEKQYSGIEGRSFDFTLGAEGRISDVKGLDAIFPNRGTAGPAYSWIDGLFPQRAFPHEGISIGRKWKSEREVTGMPLDDLVWLSNSTYLRNESCSAAAPAPSVSANAPGHTPAACATILVRYQMSRRGSPQSDATPPDYRQNGLRTSGSWAGSGDSLDSISLADGLLVSSTENSTQDVDYRITSASSGSSIRRKGRVQSQLIIKLVPESN
ncbi:MAG TPA: hypothetical protein VHX36_03500 [Candidatus Acidoferrales bacterium]|nr:hypothetical protein [Candidatus Acidoferrales bacterium]